MDSGASSHLTPTSSTLTSFRTLPSSFSRIVVGNGCALPITSAGSYQFPTSNRLLQLYDVLVSPDIISNLVFVRKFTTDNLCSVEFDPFGLSVKDINTKAVIHRCNSFGDLYPLFLAPPQHALSALAVSESTWHRRLGHPGAQVLSRLRSSSSLSSLANKFDTSLCHACQLGYHVRLPFSQSLSRACKPFE